MAAMVFVAADSNVRLVSVCQLRSLIAVLRYIALDLLLFFPLKTINDFYPVFSMYAMCLPSQLTTKKSIITKRLIYKCILFSSHSCIFSPLSLRYYVIHISLSGLVLSSLPCRYLWLLL